MVTTKIYQLYEAVALPFFAFIINIANRIFNMIFLSWFYLLARFLRPDENVSFDAFVSEARSVRSVFEIFSLFVVIPVIVVWSILEYMFDSLCYYFKKCCYNLFFKVMKLCYWYTEFLIHYTFSCLEEVFSSFVSLVDRVPSNVADVIRDVFREFMFMFINFLFFPARVIAAYMVYPFLIFFAVFRPREFAPGGGFQRIMTMLGEYSDPDFMLSIVRSILYKIFIYYPLGENFYLNFMPVDFKHKLRFWFRFPAFVLYFYVVAPIMYVKHSLTAFVCRHVKLRYLINYISIFSNERIYRFVDAVVLSILISLAVWLFKKSVFLCYSVVFYIIYYLTFFKRNREYLLASIGYNKSKFKENKGKVDIKVVNFDPNYNFAVVQKGIITKDTNNFYKLRGKTLVFVNKKLVKTYDVPIFNVIQLKFDVMNKGLPLSVYDLKYYDKYYYRASSFDVMFESSLFVVFVSALFEEVIKCWCPYFGFIEYCYKISLNHDLDAVVGSLWPLGMHLVSLYLPFPLRVVLHFVWNMVVLQVSERKEVLGMMSAQSAKDFLRSDASMKMVELSKIIELAQLVYEKKPVRFVRALAHFGYVDKIVEFLENFSIDNLLTILSLDEYVMTTSSDEKFASIVGVLNSVMPPKLAASPTLIAVVKLISLLFGSMIFKNFSTYKEFIPIVDFSDISSMEYTKVVCETFVCLYKSLKRSYDENDLWYFFLDNKIFALKRDICVLLEMTDEDFMKGADSMVEKINLEKDNHFLLYSVRISERKGKLLREQSYLGLVKECNQVLAYTSYDVKENIEAISKIDDCILGISKSGDDRVNHLYKNLVEKRKFLRNTTSKMLPRTPPFFVVLLGNYGVGKTFLIEDIISMYCAHRGIEFRSSMRGDFHFGNKYPAEGVSEEVTIAVMNDELGDHSQDPKTDRISMMEYLRAFMDTDSLHFKQADVSKKGLVYNDISLCIMTTNDATFLFSEDCGKLERRFGEHGCILDVVMLNDEMKEPFSKEAAKALPKDYVYRRSHLAGFVCQVSYSETDPKHLVFDRRISQEPLSFGKVLGYTYQRLESHSAVCVSKAKLAQHKCKGCGVQMNNHFDRGTFYPIKAGCEFYESDFSNTLMYCKCGLLRDHDVNDFNLCVQIVPRVERPIMTADVVPTNFFDLCITTVWILFWSWACKTAFVNGVILMKDFSKALITHKDDLTLIASEYAYGFTTNYINHVKLAARTQAHFYYNRIKIFLRDYKFVFGMLVAGGALKVFIDFMGPKITQTGEVILKDNVDHESCMIAGYVKSEVAFPDPKKQVEWNKQGMKVSKCELITVGTSLKDMYNMLKKRIYRMEFHYAEDPLHFETGWIVSLNASYCLINRHYVYDESDKFRVGFFKVYVEPENPIVVVSDEALFSVVKSSRGFKTDVLIMKNNMPFAQKDFLKFFMDDVGPVQVPISLTNDISSLNGVVEASPQNMYLVNGDWCWKRVFPDAKQGDCGNLAIGNFKGTSVILGLTSYMFETVGFQGRTLYAGGPVITLKMVSEAIKAFPEPYVSEMLLSSKLQDVGPLHENSDLRNLHSPYVYNVGSLPNARSDTFSSKIKKSPWFDETVSRCDKHYAIPAQTQGTTPTNGYQSVFTQTMRHSTMVSGLEEGALDRACTRYSNYFMFALDQVSPNVRLSKITLEESFLGDPSQYIDRCNFTSSIGTEERHFVNRAGLFKKIWSDESQYKYHLNPGFKQELERRINMMHDRVIHVMSTSGAVKDEIRSQEKLLNFQLRLFYLIDIYSNTMAKMYVIPLVILLMRYPYFSKCFGGLNSGSSEWDDLYHYLVKNGLTLTDLDFAGYDMSHSAQMFRKVALFFYILAKKYYSNENDAVMVFLIVYSLCFKIFIYNGSVAFTIKGLPSGHMLTLIINSVVNVLLMLMAFEKLCPELADKFFEHVFPATVGDDNLAGLSDQVKDRFNVSTISSLYYSWGYVVTNANKSENLSAFIDKRDAVFLKRKFRYENGLELYVAPLDHDSIYKMLSFIEIPSGMSETQHYAVLFDVAQREFFLHGKEVFEEFISFASKIALKHNVFVSWKTFDQLLDKFKSKEEAFMNWV